MICRFKPVVNVFLLVLMVATSGSMAQARGVLPAAGQIVLCVGDKTVMVAVDQDGQPVDTGHYCPDCIVHPVIVPEATSIEAATKETTRETPPEFGHRFSDSRLIKRGARAPPKL